jgi:GxxExxY protein
LRGLEIRPGKRMQVAYKGLIIGDVAFGHLLVEGKIMIFPIARNDLRAVHFETLKGWMRLCNVQLGILANFNAVRLETAFLRL